MLIAGLLPFLCFCALVAFLHVKRPGGLRESVVYAVIVSSLWAVAGTEFLSLFGGLKFWPLILWWSVPLAVLAKLIRDRRSGCRFPQYQIQSKCDWLLLSAIVVFILLIGFMAAITPPNNYDSQEYHLPRQFVWMQQGHVGLFAANDERQLSMPPFSEFVGVHLMILSGGDQWLNCVQWLALVVTAIIVSLIARDLGCGVRGQLFASLFAITNPTAALQALNTKNDLVTAMFVCVSAWFTARILIEKRCSASTAFFLASGVGLAMLSKGTGMLFVVPISLLAGGAILWFDRARGLWIGAGISTLVLLINAAHFTRTYSEFGSIFGRSAKEGGYKLRNETHAPAAIISNVSRNIAMHLTFSKGSDAIVSNLVWKMHEAAGVDVNDPRTTYDRNTFFVGTNFPNSEDESRAPLHMLIAVGSFWFVIVAGRKMPIYQRLFCLLPFAAFLAFSCEIKWQVWHNRLQVPLFCLVAPVAALALLRRERFSGLLGLACFAFTFPLVINNFSKPLVGENSIFRIGREQARFHARPMMQPALHWVTNVCAKLNPSVVAIDAPRHSWIYPLQRALAALPSRPKVVLLRPIFGQRHVDTNLIPTIVIGLETPQTTEPELAPAVDGFFFAAEFGDLRLYLPKSASNSFDYYPPFHGWLSEEGIRPVEGPYPQSQLPVVRWGLSPGTKLSFAAEGQEHLLVLGCLAEQSLTNQIMRVEINGETVATNMVKPLHFQEIRISIPTLPGTNQLYLDYSAEPADGSSNAVLFQKIQIVKPPSAVHRK